MFIAINGNHLNCERERTKDTFPITLYTYIYLQKSKTANYTLCTVSKILEGNAVPGQKISQLPFELNRRPEVLPFGFYEFQVQQVGS